MLVFEERAGAKKNAGDTQTPDADKVHGPLKILY